MIYIFSCALTHRAPTNIGDPPPSWFLLLRSHPLSVNHTKKHTFLGALGIQIESWEKVPSPLTSNLLK
uniref:Putative ovule protein n=1 Tax=Solanum chacoense TaxID=4108 RepID=A0A0V0HZ66_SOLCH